MCHRWLATIWHIFYKGSEDIGNFRKLHIFVRGLLSPDDLLSEVLITPSAVDIGYLITSRNICKRDLKLKYKYKKQLIVFILVLLLVAHPDLFTHFFNYVIAT
jgi:hypothetical protein